jgi:hypothetical protein
MGHWRSQWHPRVAAFVGTIGNPRLPAALPYLFAVGEISLDEDSSVADA